MFNGQLTLNHTQFMINTRLCTLNFKMYIKITAKTVKNTRSLLLVVETRFLVVMDFDRSEELEETNSKLERKQLKVNIIQTYNQIIVYNVYR